MDNTLTFEFESLVLPGLPLTELGMSWEPDQVSCSVVQDELKITQELERISEQILNKKKGAVNNATFNYRRAEVSQDRLRLEVGLSQYRYNLLHAAFEPGMVESHPEFLGQMREQVRQEDLFDLDNLGGPLSSGVGITTVVVLADNLTVMIRRSNKVSMNANLDHPALAEGVNPEEGLAGKIDLPSVAIRSAKEELNLPIERKDVLFLGMCVDGRYWWPGIIAKVKVPFTWQEVRDRSEGARDRWERDDIRFIPYTPEGIADELRHAMEPGKGVTGFGSIALLQAGIVDFGKEVMEKACH